MFMYVVYQLLRRRQQGQYEGGGARRVRPVGESDRDGERGAGRTTEAAKVESPLVLLFSSLFQAFTAVMFRTLFDKDQTSQNVS